MIFVNLLTYFSASQSPSNGLTLCFLVTVFFPATTLTFSHSSFLLLTFVFSPWDIYSLGHKIIIIIIKWRVRNGDFHALLLCDVKSRRMSRCPESIFVSWSCLQGSSSDCCISMDRSAIQSFVNVASVKLFHDLVLSPISRHGGCPEWDNVP